MAALLSLVSVQQHRHCGLLSRAIPVHGVRRVFAAGSSGPVRYVPKEVSKTASDGNPAECRGLQITQGSSCVRNKWQIAEEGAGEPTTDANAQGVQRSRQGRGRKVPSDPAAVPQSLKESKFMREDNILINDNEKDARQDLFTTIAQHAQRIHYADTQAEDTFDVYERKSFKISNQDKEAAAREYAVSLLALTPQTEAKLRSKLSRKKYPLEVIERVISELQTCGLQSDREYSEVFARSRWNGNSWGPKRIKYELIRRGVSEENVEAGLVQVFQQVDVGYGCEDGEEEVVKWNMTKKAAGQLLDQARRRWAQVGNMNVHTRKRRMTGWLQRRGFGWEVISDLLKTLEREDVDEWEDSIRTEDHTDSCQFSREAADVE